MLNPRIRWIIAGSAVLLALSAPSIQARENRHLVVPLYSGPAPGSEHATQRELRTYQFGEDRIRNVTHPTLTAYLPANGKATGTGVIIAPGGAFLMLSIQSEGERVASWLSAHGIAAFVLKYRLNATPGDDATFKDEMDRQMQATRGLDVTKTIATTEGAKQAMADGLEAVKQIRRRAETLGISPHRIGFLGFSAGGVVAMHLATAFDSESRPDSVASIYGALPDDHLVPADAPPSFLAVAADDQLLADASAPIFSAWREKGRSVEIHEYARGGHGF